jgi:hypothetical protein
MPRATLDGFEAALERRRGAADRPAGTLRSTDGTGDLPDGR